KRHRWVGGEEIMRELGPHELDHEPGTDYRGQRKSNGRVAAVGNSNADPQRQKQAPWHEHRPHQYKMISGREMVALLSFQGMLAAFVKHRREEIGRTVLNHY